MHSEHFRRKNLLAKSAVVLIRLYQRWFSGIWGTRCIYTPSCSEYGVEAITRFGLLRGVITLCFRVVRCVPRFYPGGDDPVIEHFSLTTLMRKLKPHADD